MFIMYICQRKMKEDGRQQENIALRLLQLKKYMGIIISQNQSAFVKGRLIQDNIVVTHEIFHCLKKRDGLSRDCFVAKLDMSKAFD